MEVKLREERFIGRLRENVAALAGAGPIRDSDAVSLLRKLTDGQQTRGELEKEYPVAKSITVRITAKGGFLRKGGQAVEVSGRVVVRLDRLVEAGSDEEAMTLGELNEILSKESDLARRGRYRSVLGLYSPTGWAQDARGFVENEPAGSGWASSSVFPMLIGPEVTQLGWDKKDKLLKEYIVCFCGLTEVERTEVCKREIGRAITVQEFANLAKIAEDKGFDIEFVKKVANTLASESKDLKLTRVKGVGLVLKRTIK